MWLRDWSAIPTNSFAGYILRLPLRLIPKGSVVSVRKGINRGMKWVVGSSIHGCWIGTYELDKQGIVARFVKPGMTVLDIGGNAGFYTLAFSRLVGDSGHVYAFEPFAENANNILKHVALNSLVNVSLLQMAVSDRGGVVGFHIASSNSMGSISDERNYVIPTNSLDGLIAEGEIPVPDVIKMDVEGAESLVLKGAKNLLGNKKTVLIIALHGQRQRDECTKLLDSAGFDIFPLNGERHSSGQLEVDEIYALPKK